MIGAHPARAADPASLACIQRAEDGQTAKNASQLLRARELFAQCSAKECPSAIRQDCASWLEETQRQIPSVVVGARDADGHDVLDARASVDGADAKKQLDGTPLELDPGPHVIRVERAGAPPVEVRVVVRAGEKNRAVLATLGGAAPAGSRTAPPPPPPTPESRGVPAVSFVLGGLGIAAGGVFAYFAVRGKSDADKLKSTCAPGCSSSDVDAVHTKLVIADVALGVGVVSLGLATVLAIRAVTTSSKSALELRVAPTLGGAAGALRLTF